MRVTINGEECDVADGSSIAALIIELGLDGGPVAVEVNREIVPRKDHGSHVVHPGDALEIVHFVGGG